MNDIPGWRLSLTSALHRNRHLVYSRYFQLATVGLEGRPANRTVVFRGFFYGASLHRWLLCHIIASVAMK